MLSMTLGALVGALVFLILILFVNDYRWVEKTSESGGVLYNLVWLSRVTFYTLFQTPWGATGALVGGGVGWLIARVRQNPGSPSKLS